MPTYEFRCPDGTIIERVFKMSEVPDSVPAPDGNGMAVRIISGGLDPIFKGSGFYITDYGKDGKKDQRAAATKTTPAKSDAGESKSDASTTKSDAAPAKADKKSDSGSSGPSSSGPSGAAA